MRQLIQPAVIAVILCSAPCGFALDARAYLTRAVDLLNDQQYSLARTYLEPVLIDPFLGSGERSNAYYLRGASFLAQNMPVSARKDFNRAIEFTPNHAPSLLKLGRLHLEGLGIEKDPRLAFQLFEQAAQQEDHPAALHELGQAYLKGTGTEKNVLKAREYLTKAAESGYPYAMLSLAGSYRAQSVADPQPDIALAWYNKAVNAGVPGALLSIGFMFANGEFGEPDEVKAADYYQQAVDAGVASAAPSLAYAYVIGAGVEIDYAKARELYETAVAADIPASYVGMGYLYEAGLGVEKDIATAVGWYERAANAGDVNAMHRLVALHLQQDEDAQALRWSRLAAATGSAQAYNDYAWLLATSKSPTLRNGTLALDQASKAVEQNDAASYLDTLAAAYAELGNFEEAVAVQQRALERVSPEEEPLKDEFERRLAQYQRNQPWRE
jgi:TPR repeat protein